MMAGPASPGKLAIETPKEVAPPATSGSADDSGPVGTREEPVCPGSECEVRLEGGNVHVRMCRVEIILPMMALSGEVDGLGAWTELLALNAVGGPDMG